jgi:hypothetical protein
VDSRVESKICSFCGEQGSQENRLAGGLGAMICVRCLEHFYDVTRTPERIASESWPVWDEMSDADLLSKLPLILRSAAQNADFAIDWVGLIRARGISWAQIGKVLGVSRQAAWERFASNLPRADAAADGR